MKLLLGLIFPTSGEAVVFGKDVLNGTKMTVSDTYLKSPIFISFLMLKDVPISTGGC